MKLPLLGLSLAAMFAFCSCAHQIDYRLRANDVWSESTIPGTVKVETFVDNAPKDEKINLSIGKDPWRINGREGYPDGEIAPGVSRMVAKHLDHSNVFDGVVYPNETGSTDYVLTGEIADYNAMGKTRRVAESALLLGTTIGSIPGAAVTAAATVGVKTDVNANVELRNLKLKDAQTGKTVWKEGRVAELERKRAHFLQADTDALFKRADQNLKAVNAKVVESLGRSNLAKKSAATAAPAKSNRARNAATDTAAEKPASRSVRQQFKELRSAQIGS